MKSFLTIYMLPLILLFASSQTAIPMELLLMLLCEMILVYEEPFMSGRNQPELQQERENLD